MLKEPERNLSYTILVKFLFIKFGEGGIEDVVEFNERHEII